MKLKPFILLLFIANNTIGQEFPIIGQFTFNEMIINPASTGDKNALQGLVSWRQQWAGIQGAPVTQNFSIQTPFKKQDNMSVGMVAYSDKIGVTSQQGVFLNFSYKLKIDDLNSLRFGLSGGSTFNRTLYSELIINDQLDPNFKENTPLFIAPNFSFGTKYYHKKLEIGFSIPNILTSTFLAGGYTKTYNDFTNYNFISTAKYTYKLTKDINIIPRLLMKFHPIIKEQIDVIVGGCYKEKYALGIGYRTYEGLLMNFKINVNEQISFGAQYEVPMAKNKYYKVSSFELLFIYTSFYKSKASNPRY